MRVEQLGKTVQEIYAAATDPSRWRNALLAIEEWTGSTGAVVDLVPVAGRIAPYTFAGSFSQEDCEVYATRYQAICPRIAFGVQHPEIRTHYDRLILSEAEMDRNPVYEWLGTHGLRYYVAGEVTSTSDFLAYFSLQRSRRQGHVEADDVQAFELVRPHLAQALAIAHSLNLLTGHRRFSDALLDSLPQAIFGLDRSGRLMFVNASADEMLSTHEFLFLEHGRLGTADRSLQRKLDSLVTSALSDCTGGAMRLFSSAGRRPAAARVSRIVLSASDPFLQPAVLVVVTHHGSAAPLDEQMLRDLYDLTPAEARTAAALHVGHSIQSAARLLEVSGETLRSHLKAVFRKVGVSRQQDLVRMLAELELNPTASPSPE